MAPLVWVMVGLALWHFTVYLPDHFMGGIAGAFVGAVIGALVGGFILTGVSIPSRDDVDLITLLEGVPGTVVGMGIVWFLGVRQEREAAAPPAAGSEAFGRSA